MVELISHEADKAGSPLTDREREALARENSRSEPLPEDLRQRAKELIAQIFKAEPWDEFENDPKCFSSSMERAGDGRYPNVVALAEEVGCEIAATYPSLTRLETSQGRGATRRLRAASRVADVCRRDWRWLPIPLEMSAFLSSGWTTVEISR
jgi:hypothetical protein